MIDDTKTTDEFDHVRTNLCEDDTEVKVITNALNEALALYQWEYQNACYRAKRDITNQLNKALIVVKEHLNFLGQYTLIQDLEEAFEGSDAGLRISNILTLVGKYMKNCCLNATEPVKVQDEKGKSCKWTYRSVSIDKKRYENVFAKAMEKAFIEWCEVYPLDKAPDHFDNNFEPTL